MWLLKWYCRNCGCQATLRYSVLALRLASPSMAAACVVVRRFMPYLRRSSISTSPLIPLPHCIARLLVRGTTRALWCAGAESVARFACDVFERPHAARTGGLSPLRLLAPVVLPNARARVSAVGAGVLLNVERSRAATPAEDVGLVVTLSEAGRSLRHFGGV